jgi:hypothetical protein
MMIHPDSQCDFNKCESGDFFDYYGSFIRPRNALPPEELATWGHVDITINGEPVTEATEMHRCIALKNYDGHTWKPNQNGQFEVEVEIANANKYSFIQFSSIILL